MIWVREYFILLIVWTILLVMNLLFWEIFVSRILSRMSVCLNIFSIMSSDTSTVCSGSSTYSTGFTTGQFFSAKVFLLLVEDNSLPLAVAFTRMLLSRTAVTISSKVFSSVERLFCSKTFLIVCLTRGWDKKNLNCLHGFCFCVHWKMSNHLYCNYSIVWAYNHLMIP